jgi:uncharacterized membrane protein YfhO
MQKNIEKLVALAVLSLVCLVNAAALWPELSISRAPLNDDVLHLTLADRAARQIEHVQNPLDNWTPEFALGFPVLRTYQPLSHLVVAGLHVISVNSISIVNSYLLVRFIAIALLPLSFFVCARLLGFSWGIAAAASLLAPLVSTNFLYGIEYASFTWAGTGLFAQAVATHFLLLAIGFGWIGVRTGRRVILAGILVALTLLSQLIYGYIAALTVVLMAALPDDESPRLVRLRRAVAIGGIALLGAAFQIVPLLTDQRFIAHSRWEEAWKWDSFGAAMTLQRLFTGEMLDHGRLPILSVLALAGVALWAWKRWRGAASPAETFAAAGAALWIAIYFGRPFWGPALTVLGMSEDMHLHRVIGGAQIFLVLLAAVALGECWQRLAARRAIFAAVVVTFALLYPMVRERSAYLANNRTWGEQSLHAVAAEQRDIDGVIAAAKARGGRVYAGLGANWGARFLIGSVPVYAFLGPAHVPAVSYLYHAMSLPGDLMVRFNDQNPAHYRLFNVRTAVAPINVPMFSPRIATASERFGRLQTYETPGGGYFDLVDAAAAVHVTRRNFYDINDAWLQGDWPAKQSYLFLDWGGGSPAGIPRIDPGQALPGIASAAPAAGTVGAEKQDGEVYGAEVELLRPAYVLFKMGWHPNWKAYVDGAAQPVVTLSPGFAAVAAQPGRHRVEFRYEPGATKLALAIGGWLAIALIGFRGGRFIRALAGIAARPVPRSVAKAAAVALLAAPVALPLFNGAVLAGHDAFVYFPRLIEAHRNFAAGTPLLRWAPDLSRGYGQPLFVFHPPFFYWIAEIGHVAGLNPVVAVNVAAALLVFVAAGAMFRLGRLYFGETGGWIAAAAYLYAPYFAVDLYVRSAIEEVAAMSLFAVALYGLAAYAKERRRRDWILAACAFAAVLCCNFPMALVSTPLLIAFAGFTVWQTRSREVAIRQTAAVALGFALGAWAWIPGLLETQNVSMSRVLSGAFQYTQHFVYFQQLFSTFWGYGNSVAGPNDGMSFSLGWSHLALAVAGYILATRRRDFTARFFGAACLVFCFFLLQDAQWLWENLPLLPYIEFPWRLLGPAALSLAMAVAALGPALDGLGRWRGLAIAGVLALLIVPNLPHLAPPRLVDADLALWTPQKLSESGFETTTMGEVSPRWMPAPPPFDPRPKIAPADARVSERWRDAVSWTGEIHAKSAVRVWLPIAYYPGWTVRVDGHPVAAAPAQGVGMLEFEAAAGDHLVQASFGRSADRLVAEAISLAGLIALIVLARWRRKVAPVVVDVSMAAASS